MWAFENHRASKFQTRLLLGRTILKKADCTSRNLFESKRNADKLRPAVLAKNWMTSKSGGYFYRLGFFRCSLSRLCNAAEKNHARPKPLLKLRGLRCSLGFSAPAKNSNQSLGCQFVLCTKRGANVCLAKFV